MTYVKESGIIKTKQLFNQPEKRITLAQTLERISEECRDCYPSSPLKCISGCSIWKLKNELRKIHAIITQEKYRGTLLNTLKNKRRLKILETLTERTLSTHQLQKELKRHNWHHSQRTIMSEYIGPLVAAGLITSNSSRYKATIFGYRLNRLLTDFQGMQDILPPRSSCYEEKLIETLYEKPRTRAELRSTMSTESLSRVLKRLREKKLLMKNSEKHYIFYFKTRRNPQQEKLSPTEERVYSNVPEEGATAQKLAQKTNITLRRTYKYLSKLRGKKLVFRRKRPKTYKLTNEGRKISELLSKIQALLNELAQTAYALMPDTY